MNIYKYIICASVVAIVAAFAITKVHAESAADLAAADKTQFSVTGLYLFTIYRVYDNSSIDVYYAPDAKLPYGSEGMTNWYGGKTKTFYRTFNLAVITTECVQAQWAVYNPDTMDRQTFYEAVANDTGVCVAETINKLKQLTI